MGREVKRVPLDFDWPTGMVWKGYICPYSSRKCRACDESGYNLETLQLYKDYYDFDRTGRRWIYNITQDEVDALIAEDRLWDLTHEYVRGEGWKLKEPLPVITAEFVNKWAQKGIGHDAINCLILVMTRAKRLGVYGHCKYCGGKGRLWCDEKYEKLAEEWKQIEPPEGEGWQVWETVSEGSPVSPVFVTAELLIDWLANEEGYSLVAARNFVLDTGWAPSAVVKDGKYLENIESLGE
jgi:hypothetical protein